MGVKYDFKKILDERISFGLGSEYRYDSAEFENNGSYSQHRLKEIMIIYQYMEI